MHQSVVILHKQHRFVARERDIGAVLGLCHYLFAGHAGEIDLEGRSDSGFTGDRDMPAALLDDAIHGSQAKPGSFAQSFGGEERFEDPRACTLVHAHSRVADRKQHVSAGPQVGNAIGAFLADVGGLDHQGTAGGHGIPGIDDQIHDNLLDLPRIGPDLPEVVSAASLELDVLADQPTQHLFDTPHHFVQIQDARCHDLFSAEGE